MKNKFLRFLLGVGLLIFSFAIMAFFPVRTSILTWIIVLVSAFSFIFGYFYFGSAFEGPKGKVFKFFKKALFSLSGVAMIAYGIYALIAYNLNSKGLGIFSLMIIYGPAMELYAFDKLFNHAVDGIKTSEDITVPIEELYEAFKDIDTPMGRPWIGNIINVDSDCIIYGPTDEGSFLFGYYLFGSFNFAQGTLLKMFKNEDEAKAHMIDVDWDQDNTDRGQLYHMITRMLPDFYIGMFETYSNTGRAECEFVDLLKDKKPMVYEFKEKFAVVTQKYKLLGPDRKPKYYLHGKFPFWTFKLENAADGWEVAKSKRIIWHILFPTYDIYLNGEKYGRMKWLFRILRSKFRMKTADGEVVVKEMTATIGDQFMVYKNDSLIGTISQKIGFKNVDTFVEDMVYDNFVVMVFDERDLPLVTTLCVMLGSFKNHGINKE